jgi:hypothetical protein
MPATAQLEGPLTCNKCGRVYDNPDEGFYWETRHGFYRRPCKKCIRDYNAGKGQRSRRIKYQREYYRRKKNAKERI